MLLGKALIAAAEPSFKAATAIGHPKKAAEWKVFPAEQVPSPLRPSALHHQRTARTVPAVIHASGPARRSKGHGGLSRAQEALK